MAFLNPILCILGASAPAPSIEHPHPPPLQPEFYNGQCRFLVFCCILNAAFDCHQRQRWQFTRAVLVWQYPGLERSSSLVGCPYGIAYTSFKQQVRCYDIAAICLGRRKVMMESPTLATVAGPAGCRLHVSWGTGNELHCTSLASSQPNNFDSFNSCVQWCVLILLCMIVKYKAL